MTKGRSALPPYGSGDFSFKLAKNYTHSALWCNSIAVHCVWSAQRELKNVSVMDTERLNVMSRALRARACSYFLLSKSWTPYMRLISTALWITRPGVFYCVCSLEWLTSQHPGARCILKKSFFHELIASKVSYVHTCKCFDSVHENFYLRGSRWFSFLIAAWVHSKRDI